VIDSWLTAAARRYGTPLFVYFTDEIQDRIEAIEDAFEARMAVSFAVKSNPNPHMLAWLNGRIAYLDVSSIGELRLAREGGWSPSLLSFTGPGKREFELIEAIDAGIGEVVVESVSEARLVSRIAQDRDVIQPVLLRISPDRVPKGFGDQMAGRPCAFGIDIEDADQALSEIADLPGIVIEGLHIYSGTQCLNPAAIVENYRSFIALFTRLCATHGIQARKLVFGSGLGIPYHDGDNALALSEIAEEIAPDLDRLRMTPELANAELVLELGRYLVGEAGYFLTGVTTIKRSRGTRIAICDGGMNNHLPAAGLFGMVMRRNYRMHKLGRQGPLEKVDLVGPLCTSIDRIGSGVELPGVEEGDVIAIHNSGAYGLTASPFHFISHSPPREVMVVDGAMHDVSRFVMEEPDRPILLRALGVDDPRISLGLA
jgi:diaminopimelate decarboxylase